MRVLSLTIPLLILLVAVRIADSPHGSDFEVSCSVCHSPKGWELDREIYSFDHNSTKLPLEGQHTSIGCRLCHPTLVFSDAGTDCFDCHTDMHYQTVGFDCGRCHTTESWIVNNIADVHLQSRFPLLGVHLQADCMDCHPSASLLRFEPLRIECVDCHMEDYAAASNPNHVLGNVSTNCIECHSMSAFTWAESGFNHFFFPLTEGHEVFECSQCHTTDDYSNISSDCFSCHETDFNATSNPNHITAEISTDCMQCHTTLPGWKPALFPIHDALFPLTEGHALSECTDCHTVDDYSNISSDCYSCHQTDYKSASNPNHIAAALSVNCEECHTTRPGWKPADFRVHDSQFFPIFSGKHQGQWSNCVDCHSNTDNYSVFTCLNCHEHNRTEMDDKHSEQAGYQYISTACLMCHPTGTQED
ncbi:hypothetical protein ACFLTU_05325 [Bacteroidota bacterium]